MTKPVNVWEKQISSKGPTGSPTPSRWKKVGTSIWPQRKTKIASGSTTRTRVLSARLPEHLMRGRLESTAKVIFSRARAQTGFWHCLSTKGFAKPFVALATETLASEESKDPY